MEISKFSSLLRGYWPNADENYFYSVKRGGAHGTTFCVGFKSLLFLERLLTSQSTEHFVLYHFNLKPFCFFATLEILFIKVIQSIVVGGALKFFEFQLQVLQFSNNRWQK